VLGDNGRVIAAVSNDHRRLTGTWALTLGLVQTTDPTTGAGDTITTGAGNDVVLGGAGRDRITAGDGDNVVLGDHGYVDWTAADRAALYGTGAMPGDDADPTDVDRVVSTEPGIGGGDTISTGAGDDLVVGGTGDDRIEAFGGKNVVLGDSGMVLAARDDLRGLRALPMTLGLVITTAPTVGGDDTITTNGGDDVVLGGVGADTLQAGDGDNVVLGDNGYVDWTAGDGGRSSLYDSIPTYGGDDILASDIDRVVTTDPTAGGADTITTGTGFDLVLGGTGGDVIRSGAGNDLVFGDFGRLLANGATGGVTARSLPLDLAPASHPFRFESTWTQNADGGGDDVVHAGVGDDIVIGGQGSDSIWGEEGDDDLIGGHNVAGGQDGGDQLDGGAGNDVVAVRQRGRPAHRLGGRCRGCASWDGRPHVRRRG
jgi:Ca2+-binding RTX toxin-like protein